MGWGEDGGEEEDGRRRRREKRVDMKERIEQERGNGILGINCDKNKNA